MFNHNNSQNFWEIVNEQKHLEGRVRSEYHSKTKFMNDFSELFEKLPSLAEKLTDASAEEKERIMANVKGYFDRDIQEKHDVIYGL